MTHTYLNPLELFRLTKTRVELLTPDLLRARKRRFLSELELEGKTAFTYHGREYTRNDLDRAVSEAGTPEGRAAYIAAGNVEGLAAFLVSGAVPPPGIVKPEDLDVPALRPILINYLSEPYPPALRKAMKSKNWRTAGTLLSWQPARFGLSPLRMYGALDQYLERLLPFMVGIFERFSCNIALIYANDFTVAEHEAKRWIRGMRLFKELFPPQLTDNLPPFAAARLNALVERTLPHLQTMCSGAETRMAHEIARNLLKLPHLKTENNEALRLLLVRNKVHPLDLLNPSDMDSRLTFIGKMGIFMAIIMGVVLVLVAINHEPDPRAAEKAKNRAEVVRDFELQRQDIAKKKTTFFLRVKQLTGDSEFTVVSKVVDATLPNHLSRPLHQAPVSVENTNRVLAHWYQDTIPHVAGVITAPEDYIMTLSMTEIKAIRKAVKPNGFLDTVYLDAKINDLEENIRELDASFQ